MKKKKLIKKIAKLKIELVNVKKQARADFYTNSPAPLDVMSATIIKPFPSEPLLATLTDLSTRTGLYGYHPEPHAKPYDIP